MPKNSFDVSRNGFTLVELLVVMAILGVLISIVGAGFRSSQIRGRDAERKSDLSQIGKALELYYADYSKYPDTIPAAGGEFTDGKTIYMKEIPKDPSGDGDYYYRIPDSPLNQSYQVFAHLENSEDPDCIGGDCSAPPVTYACEGGTCNFAVTSSNVTATE